MSDTSYADTLKDKAFRRIVSEMREIGFGRMAQIVSEEWARVDAKRGGLLAVCPKCNTLFHWDTGKIKKKGT